MWTAIHRDDATSCSHLGYQRSVHPAVWRIWTWLLRAWSHRRAGIQPEDAPIDQRAVVPRIGLHGAQLFVARRRSNRIDPRLCRRRERRDAAVGGFDDQRSPFGPDNPVATFEPELVIGNDAARQEY